jgi:drug/metabolite transporter (DMT)-like permease
VWYLAIHALAIACFSSCYKIAARRGCHTPAVHLAMYLTAVAIALPVALVRGGLAADWRLAALGGLGGLSLFAAMRAFFLAMSQGGLALGWTVVSLAVVVPLGASVVVWGEMPTAWQFAGLALLVPCILLFGNLELQVEGDRRRWAALVAVASVCTGLTQVVNKACASLPGRAGETPGLYGYLTLLFATGGVLLLAMGEGSRLRLRGSEMRIGAAMGVLNLLGTWAFVMALDALPGIVVFPIKAASGVGLTALAAIAVFGERITARQALGIAVGIASAVLVNLGW